MACFHCGPWRGRDRDKEGVSDREKESQRGSGRDRERDTQRERERGRETEKETGRESAGDMGREREREFKWKFEMLNITTIMIFIHFVYAALFQTLKDTLQRYKVQQLKPNNKKFCYK